MLENTSAIYVFIFLFISHATSIELTPNIIIDNDTLIFQMTNAQLEKELSRHLQKKPIYNKDNVLLTLNDVRVLLYGGKVVISGVVKGVYENRFLDLSLLLRIKSAIKVEIVDRKLHVFIENKDDLEVKSDNIIIQHIINAIKLKDLLILKLNEHLMNAVDKAIPNSDIKDFVKTLGAKLLVQKGINEMVASVETEKIVSDSNFQVEITNTKLVVSAKKNDRDANQIL